MVLGAPLAQGAGCVSACTGMPRSLASASMCFAAHVAQAACTGWWPLFRWASVHRSHRSHRLVAACVVSVVCSHSRHTCRGLLTPARLCGVCVCVCLCDPADGDYGWGLLLRTLADVLQHDRRPAVVDASLDMVFGLLGRYSQRWDAAAWRVLIQRVVRHMLLLPPGLSPPPPQAALDSLSAGQVPAWRPLNPDGASRFASLSGTTGFGSPVVGVSPAAAAGSAGSFGSVLQFAAGSGGGGAGGAVPVGMSVAEQGLLVTTMLKRMDSFFPLLCDQAAAIRAEYKVCAGGAVGA